MSKKKIISAIILVVILATAWVFWPGTKNKELITLEKLYIKYQSDTYLRLSEKKDNFLSGWESEETTYIAIKEKNPEICLLLIHLPEYCMNNYLLINAVKENNAQLCSKVIDVNYQHMCSSMFGENLCHLLPDEKKKLCQFLVDNKEDFFNMDLDCINFELAEGGSRVVCELFMAAAQ